MRENRNLPRMRTVEQVIEELKSDTDNVMSTDDIMDLLIRAESYITTFDPSDKEFVNYDKFLKFLYREFD